MRILTSRIPNTGIQSLSCCLPRLAAMTALCVAAFVPAISFADCDEVGSDRWNELSATLSVKYDKGDYDAALIAGKQLTLICDRTPTVNFTMANLYKQMGNEDESYNYVRKASEYIGEYEVPQKLVERIWLMRAETDLPYKRELEAKTAELEALKTDFAGNSVARAQAEADREELIKKMDVMKWTGTGLGVGGGAMLVVGGIIVGLYHDKAQDQLKRAYGQNEKLNDFNKSNNAVYAGYGLLIGGFALGIAGSVMAIYSHVSLAKFKSLDSGAELSMSVSPMQANINISF